MAQRDYDVAEWKRIAKALHSGALHNDVTFETTQGALNHLYYHQESYIAAGRGHDHGQYRDFCYIHKDKPCPTRQCQLKLSVFFGAATDNRCALCNGVTMAPSADGSVAYGVENGGPWCEMSDLEQLSLKHLEHLAVYHTPYFVMLFLGSVKDKRHVFHSDQASRQELVRVIYNKYRQGEMPLTFHNTQERDITFLKLWWRYMNRQSSKVLNVKIPYYLEIPNTTTHGTWNPVHDKFADRTPEPVYSFVKSVCICRDVWCEDDVYSAPLCASPTLESVVHENDGSVVYSLKTPVSKLHIDTILDATVTTYNTRDAEPLRISLPCCKPLTPRLDSLVFEESVDCTVLLLRAIVSLHKTWIPLESWLVQEHGNDSPILTGTRHRVAAGVLGCFRDMYEKNTVPPRQLYATHRDLIKTLLVNTRTWDVVSFLPYVCMNKMYRAVNSGVDETSLRKSCCGIMVRILLPLSHEVESVVDDWWSGDALDGAHDIESQFVLLCKEGFRDLNTWDALQPESFGVRCVSLVDSGYVWLGDSVTDDNVVKRKLSEIGLIEPVRVTVIEIPPKQTVSSEGTPIAMICSPGTLEPECFRGLTSALTVNAMCVSMPDDMIMRRRDFRGSQASNNAYRGTGKRSLAPDHGSDPRDDGSARPKMSYVDMHNDEPIIIELMSLLRDTDAHNITQPSIRDNLAPSGPCYSNSFAFDSRLFNTGASQLAAVEDFNAGNSRMETIDDLDTMDTCALMHNATNRPYDILAPTLNIEMDAEEVDRSDVDFSEADLNEVNLFDVDSTISGLFPNAAVDAMRLSNDEDCDILALALSNTDKRKRPTVSPPFERVADCGDTPAGPSSGDQHIWSVHDVQLDSPVSGGSARQPSRLTERRTRQNPLPTVDASAVELPDSGLYSSEYTSDEPEVLRIATKADLKFIGNMSKWRSNGVMYSDLNNARYGTTHSPYSTMTYMTAFEIKKHKGYATRLMRRQIPDTPQTNPTVGLERVACEHGCDANTRQPSDVCRTAVEDIDSNYMMGIYTCSRLTRKFTRPNEFTYTPSDIPSVTINCKTGDRVYNAVDLSKPPERGFRYVCLHVNEFPIGMRIDTILEIKSTQALYLGHVLTTQNMAGLLIHRIFSEDVQLLEFVLDMHTRLQIHPFVARTFALHLMKMPFTDTGVTAAFVGEHVGEWNLGGPDGLANMTDSQKCTLAYHVTICLIKAQILTMSILGFPLLRLHPGRIWRDGARFKVDLLACLLDHITSKLNSQVHGRKNSKEDFDSRIAPVPGGVRAITDTLRTLDLDRFVPEWQNLPDYDVDDGDIDVFYSMYEQLTQQDVRDVDILSLLGECETYQPFTVPTANCHSAPFAPFHVQIHNQFVKWNKVIIVEPVQAAHALPLPTLIPQGPSKNKRRPSSTTRRSSSTTRRPSSTTRRPSSTTTRIPAREPDETAPAQIMLPPPRASERTPPGGSSSIQTPAMSQARASHRRADAVSLPQTPPSLETEQPASPVPDTERTQSYAYALDRGVDYINTCNSVYYDG